MVEYKRVLDHVYGELVGLMETGWHYSSRALVLKLEEIVDYIEHEREGED